MEKGDKFYSGEGSPIKQHPSGKFYFAYVNAAGQVIPYRGRLRDTIEEAWADGGECGAEFHQDRKERRHL